MAERLFTVAEANGLIPRLRTILREVGEEWARIGALQPEVQKAREKASFDGHSPFGVEYINAVSHLTYLVRQIRDLGVLLKDIDQGLCDFPYLRQGRVVYLCWRLGEDSIEYWHDTESGFSGRERLDPTDV
jgi:hypothetical protein